MPQKWPEPAKGSALDRLPSLFSTPYCPATEYLNSAESFGEEDETAEYLKASEAKSEPTIAPAEWMKISSALLQPQRAARILRNAGDFTADEGVWQDGSYWEKNTTEPGGVK